MCLRSSITASESPIYCTTENAVHLDPWKGWRCIVESMFECGRHMHVSMEHMRVWNGVRESEIVSEVVNYSE